MIRISNYSEFDKYHAYDGDDLGATYYADRTVFKTWSPYATGVYLNLYLDGEGAIALGSDFDGCTPPSWLSSCEMLPAFYRRIVERFGESVTRRLFYENAHDFFVRNETE